MTELTATQPTATRSFWIISILSLVWNLIGAATYLMSVTMTPEMLAELSEAERMLYTDIPAWVTSAYAIAVFAGLLGSAVLLMRNALAIPIFVISLIAILAQMAYTLFMSEIIEVRGPTAIILPILVTTIAAYLVWFSTNAKKKAIIS